MATLLDMVKTQSQKREERRAEGKDEAGPRQASTSIRHASWFVNEEGLVNFNAAPGVHVYLIETDDPAWPIAVRMCRTDASRRYDEDSAIQVGRGKWSKSQAGREYLFCLYEQFFLNIYFYEPGQRKENGPVAFSYIQAKPAPKPDQPAREEGGSQLGNILKRTGATPGKVITATPAASARTEAYAGAMLDEQGNAVY
jgi:hypothetical protein